MAELSTILKHNSRLQKQSLTNLISCFEDTTSYAPTEWTKDEIIHTILTRLSDEDQENFMANLEDYEEN